MIKFYVISLKTQSKQSQCPVPPLSLHNFHCNNFKLNLKNNVNQTNRVKTNWHTLTHTQIISISSYLPHPRLKINICCQLFTLSSEGETIITQWVWGMFIRNFNSETLVTRRPLFYHNSSSYCNLKWLIIIKLNMNSLYENVELRIAEENEALFPFRRREKKEPLYCYDISTEWSSTVCV